MKRESLSWYVMRFIKQCNMQNQIIKHVSLVYVDCNGNAQNAKCSFDAFLKKGNSIFYNPDEINDSLTIVFNNGDLICHDHQLGFYLIKAGLNYKLNEEFDPKFLHSDYEYAE